MISFNPNAYGQFSTNRSQGTRFAGRAVTTRDVMPQLNGMNVLEQRILGRATTLTDPRMIPMGDSKTSKKHATIMKTGADHFSIYDGADGDRSRNGTRINGVEIGDLPVALALGDQIKLGSFQWTFGQPVVESSEGFEENVHAMLDEDRLVLGREQLGTPFENFFKVNSEHVSRNHAEILKNGQVFSIRDLGSTNGTFLNGEPIGATPVPLTWGDVIRLGVGAKSVALRMPRQPQAQA